MNIDIRKNRFVNFLNVYSSLKEKTHLSQFQRNKDSICFELFIIYNGLTMAFLSNRIYLDIKEPLYDNEIINYIDKLREEILNGNLNKLTDFLRYGFYRIEIFKDGFNYNEKGIEWSNNFKKSFEEKILNFKVNLRIYPNHVRKFEVFVLGPVGLSFYIYQNVIYLYKNFQIFEKNQILVLTEEKWDKHPQRIKYKRINKINRIKEL